MFVLKVFKLRMKVKKSLRQRPGRTHTKTECRFENIFCSLKIYIFVYIREHDYWKLCTLVRSRDFDILDWDSFWRAPDGDVLRRDFKFKVALLSSPLIWKLLLDGSVTNQITNQTFVLPDSSGQETEAGFHLIL